MDRWSLAGVGALALIATASAAEPDTPPLEAALAATHPIVDLRLRSESVEQAGLGDNAHAVTLRARLGFETGRVWNTALLAEAELLWPLQTNYNSTTNGKTGYPVVADPENRELNRLQLTNTSLPATVLTLGRQRINLDDQRFVGSVGWRQNEQTFDAVRLINTGIPNLTADLIYIDRVNRVFGTDSPVGHYDSSSYLLNAAYPTPAGKLTGFVYRLEFDEAPGDSSRTTGLRLVGEKALRDVALSYAASFATQQDHGNNPFDYSAGYRALDVEGARRGWMLGAGVEWLEGDGAKGFTTPLATLHPFQGWSDKFLATPPDGIDDRYVKAGYRGKNVGVLGSLSATVRYHRYAAERTDVDFGSETEFLVQASWRRLTGSVKYADYRAEGFGADTRKLWVQIEYAP